MFNLYENEKVKSWRKKGRAAVKNKYEGEELKIEANLKEEWKDKEEL